MRKQKKEEGGNRVAAPKAFPKRWPRPIYVVAWGLILWMCSNHGIHMLYTCFRHVFEERGSVLGVVLQVNLESL